MKLLSVLLLLAASAMAQVNYVVSYEANLSAAASVVTVQAPAANAARDVKFHRAVIYCSVQCDVTLERDGTAASTTALTPAPKTGAGPAAKSTAYRTSNVGAGTVLEKFTLPALGTQTIDLTGVIIYGAGTGNNVTLRTSSITGIARITFHFCEEQ